MRRESNPSLALLLSLSALCVLKAADGPFSIAQVMTTPFASEPLVSPSGTKVAWLLNESGKRGIWIASAPDWHGKRVTNFNSDDGQEIADLVWAPNSAYLLFARGGDFENGGENPNPGLNPTKPEQNIWYVSADGSVQKKLTDGRAPAISPRGDLVVFLRGGHVFAMPPDGGDAKNIIAQQGAEEDLQWSPDGGELAFTSARSGHAFIGIYSVADKSLRFLDASVDRDLSPVWSPDGARIAYLRLPVGGPRFGPGPRRTGFPWSIRIADVKSGIARAAFTASEGQGSVFHGITAPHAFFWAAGNRIVFPWERTGWCHLYSVPAEGGTPLELTPGDGEVEHAALSTGSKAIFYAANIGEIDARHLWSVAADGSSAPKQLTAGERIDWAPQPAADSALVFLASSYNESAHAMVRTANGKTQPLAPETVPSTFPAASLIKPQPVILTAADGMQIHGQLFLPAGNTARHPALVFFHGGSRRQMLLGFHYMYYYSNAYALNQFLASQGYIVLSVNYRSGIGYGLNFREALNYGAEGGSEFNDVIGAGLYLKNRADADPARIGVWGGSYGGYLTAMALSRASDLFAAGVDFHGVHDWSSLREFPVPAGGDPKELRAYQEALRLAFDSSPLATVDGWRSPVLLIHGDDDRNVSFSQTLVLAEALRARHVAFEELIFPNEIHDFLRQSDWVTAYQATAGFFARKLR